MTHGRPLSEAEFLECFAAPMENVTSSPDAKVDIWPYVDALDLEALGLPSINDVQHVYRDAKGRFDQVLIGTGRFNTLLVVVIDLQKNLIFGHRVLDLGDSGARGGHLSPL
jgi:hypothetical protein